MLKTSFIRDHRGRIRGQVISGYQDGSEIIKNWHGQVIGRTVPNVGTKTADNHILARTSDPGFLFNFSEDNDE